tara:strand:- start:371 stop:1135 length:765 start_codon:yes stop_codon:yes gene_type:complete
MKSPIKENINNFKALSFLKDIIPKGSVTNSFLFFSGMIEFSLAESERFILAHTSRYVVYEFWKCAMEDPNKIAEMAESMYPFEDVNAFYSFQENWPKYKDPFVRSALFFLLNRCSGNGWISAGKFDDRNFNPIAISHLKKFSPKNFFPIRDKNDSLTESIKNVTREGDYMLFPIGKFDYNLFEHGRNKGYEMTTVLHKELCEYLCSIEKKWVVLYKTHPQLFKLYEGSNIIMIDKYGRKTTDKDSSEDLVIANF